MITALHWYRATDLHHGITRIREICLDPAVACNIWLIRGRDRDLLFDAGTGLMSLKQCFPRLARHPVVCVASHTHFDHCGGCYEFEDVRVHSAEADILARPDRDNTTVEGYMTPDLFSALPFEGFRPEDYQVRPVPHARALNDNEVIDLGDRQIEVLHLPGHSPGTIGLWEAGTGILFSGDAVYDGRLYDDVYHSDVREYRRTMMRLLDLPVSEVHGGHFDSFGRARMKTLIRNWLDKGE